MSARRSAGRRAHHRRHLRWLVAIVVLFVIAILTAVAETAITRISRGQGQRAWPRTAAPAAPGARRPRRARPSAGSTRCCWWSLVCQLVQATLTGVLAGNAVRRLGRGHRHRSSTSSIVFVLAEAAPKTWALQHPERAALLARPGPVRLLVDFAPLRLVARGLIGLTNVILPGKGLKEGPVRVRGGAARRGRRGRRGRRHRRGRAARSSSRSSSSATPSCARSWCPGPTWSPSTTTSGSPT